MHPRTASVELLCVLFLVSTASGQVTVPLPGRTVNKLLPDYLRPFVYALNQGSATNAPGTLLVLDSTNGTILAEIPVNHNPTDMAMTPAGDAIYVINAGSQTISKVDLNLFAVGAEKGISIPNTYGLSNVLHVAAGRSNLVYFTDGTCAPSITTFDYAGGTNVAVYDDGNGAGGIQVTRDGHFVYRWSQFDCAGGNPNSWVTRYDALTNVNLTALESSFVSARRQPTDTPIFLDAAERWVFNKQQMFAATNVSVLLNQFSENIYGISLDGSVAFGSTKVFSTQTGATITNLAFSTTIQTLSGDQRRLFRYNASATNLVIYDMAGIASIGATVILPTPADGSVVFLPLTNLTWTASPTAVGYDVYFGTNQAGVAGAAQGSGQYLGRVPTPGQDLSQALVAGATYYWRVDVVGSSSTNTGSVWSFTAGAVSVNPSQLDLGAVAGSNAAPTTVSLTILPAATWTASVSGGNWMTLNPTNGTSSSNVTVTLNTAGLADGRYTNAIEFTTAGFEIGVPVVVEIRAPQPGTLRVPVDFPTIQAAVDHASASEVETVLVDPGVYQEAVSFGDKDVRLVSAQGPSVTSIMAPAASAVTMGRVTTNALLCGFTLTNSANGVSLSWGSPVIVSNTIIDCETGISISDTSWPAIYSNSIVACAGWGIYGFDGGALLIEGNFLQGDHGAIYMEVPSEPITVRNNTVRDTIGDAVRLFAPAAAFIVQNVIFNSTGSGFSAYSGGGSWLVLNNTIIGNGLSAGSGIELTGYTAGLSVLNNIVVGAQGISCDGFEGNFPTVADNDVFSSPGPGLRRGAR